MATIRAAGPTPTQPRAFHVWRVANTGTAAFLSRAYNLRTTAKAAAARWSDSTRRRAFAFVRECSAGIDCPRPPGRPTGEGVQMDSPR